MIRRFFLAAGLAAALAVPAPTATAATILTGDRLDGVPVIERLDVSDAPLGQITRYYFRVTNQASGQGWYVPVLVARGAKPGKKLLLTAAIHGDELNGIDVIHQLFAGLDPARMSGTVVAIPGLNAPGLLNASRNFTPSHGGGGLGKDIDRIDRACGLGMEVDGGVGIADEQLRPEAAGIEGPDTVAGGLAAADIRHFAVQVLAAAAAAGREIAAGIEDARRIEARDGHHGSRHPGRIEAGKQLVDDIDAIELIAMDGGGQQQPLAGFGPPGHQDRHIPALSGGLVEDAEIIAGDLADRRI